MNLKPLEIKQNKSNIEQEKNECNPKRKESSVWKDKTDNKTYSCYPTVSVCCGCWLTDDSENI